MENNPNVPNHQPDFVAHPNYFWEPPTPDLTQQVSLAQLFGVGGELAAPFNGGSVVD
jgi:hypothetical protein